MDIQMELIVACTKSGGIGKNQTLPWRIKKDMDLFKKITLECPEGYNNVVIMGRKTWESIPEKFRPLKDRVNIILSTTMEMNYDFIEKYPNTHICNSIDNLPKLIMLLSDIEKLHKGFIIGGSSLYKTAMESFKLSALHISHVNTEYDCDTFFPIDLIDGNFKKDIIQQYDKFSYVKYISK